MWNLIQRLFKYELTLVWNTVQSELIGDTLYHQSFKFWENLKQLHFKRCQIIATTKS